MTIHIDADADPSRPLDARPKASVVQFDNRPPRVNRASDPGGNFDHPSWEYDFADSRWFASGELVYLKPGEHTDLVPHCADGDGPVERSLRVFHGHGVLRTERLDEPVTQFDVISVPPDTPCQVRNTGTAGLWLGVWSLIGDDADRDTGMDANTVGTEPTVIAFAETMPKHCPESPAVGCNTDRLAWISEFPELEWLSDSTVMRLDPGTYASVHTHFENEGPHEEIYWVMDGTARLVTEYRDATLERFDCAFFPTNTPHGIGNVGTDTLWVGAWGSRGGVDGEFDIATLDVVDRPGQIEEYERVMAARRARGLPLPPDVEVLDE